MTSTATMSSEVNSATGVLCVYWLLCGFGCHGARVIPVHTSSSSRFAGWAASWFGRRRERGRQLARVPAFVTSQIASHPLYDTTQETL